MIDKIKSLESVAEKREFLKQFWDKNKSDKYDLSLNDLLILYYSSKGFKNLKTRSEWNEEKREVKRDEKPLVLEKKSLSTGCINVYDITQLK